MIYEEGSFCVDCKWLCGVRHNLEDWEKWTCHNENNIITRSVNTVSGLPIIILKEVQIKAVREQRCNGKWYEEYIDPITIFRKRLEKEAAERRTKKTLSNVTADDL